ncbi:class I SAM-dependent methyltransferase [Subtercola endophyticus]|uniref:class I SAM-dependent methyltransferase n=1 Tax=Subtercola endophyticus TaxID=2895559 RepID=UPI001E63925E|nr:methyltransferase domain-containing protein [Subtercola endophyticus]UFS60552.1 methyltransferase domain-containing protein [Subtercola endophyticus]
MSFDVTADAYLSFMGRYSEPLAGLFADWSGVRRGQRALDVGCGAGALTEQLVMRLGAPAVAAVDPSASFVSATQQRLATVDVQQAGAELLPFADAQFDAVLAQLVIHLMPDAVAGLREMARVTKPGGLVSACVWDHAGEHGPLATFWNAVHDLDPDEPGEATMPGTSDGDLAALFSSAGLVEVEASSLTVTRHYDSFDEWWQPYLLGVGPAGAYAAELSDAERSALRARCVELLPAGAFDVSALAWCARGVVA